MMSAEFPEIIPEPFNYPCASYNGNAEDFINDVVDNCHSSYGGLSYSDATCPQLFAADSSCHSVLLHELTSGQDHHLLHEPHDRESQGRNSYSCDSNVHIKILVKEPTVCVDGANTCSPPEDQCTTESEDNLMGGVMVQVECADENQTSLLDKTPSIEECSQNLLATKRSESPQSSLNGDFENGGSPTPTPSYADRLTTPTVEYPGEEAISGCGVRGGEVAKLDEDGIKSEIEQNHDEANRNDVDNAEEVSVHDRRTTPHDRTHANWLAPFFLPFSRRRTGSTLLQHFPAAHHMLPIPPTETRKLSDSAVCTRREKVKRTAYDLRKQRCLSDSEAPNCSFPLDEYERESSAHGCDSGFQDDKGSRFQESMGTHFSSPRVSLQSLDLLSQDEGSESYSRCRRVTPFPPFSLLSQDGSQSDDTSGVYQSSNSGNPGTMVHPRERNRRSLMKHYSQGSISGVSVGGASLGGASSVGASSDSPSLSSILDCQSNITGVTDLLSSLGFDDFDSPQLVPDRFIPKELDYLKPSCMKVAFTEQSISPDPPRSPDSLASGQSYNQPQLVVQQIATEPSDLPLGATAENFLDYKARPSSPVLANNLSNVIPAEEEPHDLDKKLDGTPLFTDTTAIMDFTRSRILETVPEETASDLSPSPRWFSPRVSMDHSVLLDLAEGKLGASLNVQKVRKRSLPTNREGYRWSIGSLVESDTGDSIHLSVTSYDDMIAAEREKERESLPPMACDDTILGGLRRRRKGVYNPPQTLLSWLSTQKTIDEEEVADPDELPWPFNEQAHLRKSLTEISLAQKNSLAESQLESSNDDQCDQNTSNSHGSQRDIMSVSPISTPNSRHSPQPAISDDENDDVQVTDVTRHSHYHKELAKVSSHTSSPSDPLFSSPSDPLFSSSDVTLSSGLEPDTNPSTVSLLQTERGSIATLSSEHSLTDGLKLSTTLHVLPDEARPPVPTSLSMESRPHMLSAENSTVSAYTCYGVHTSDLVATTNNLNEDCNYPPCRMQENTSHSSSELGPSVDAVNDTALKEDSIVGRRSSDVHHEENLLDTLPASHIGLMSSVQTSCSMRRHRFAERKPKSLEERMLPPSLNNSTGRVRRKAVYGDAPPSPLTEQFLLTPTRGEMTWEQKEVEKYMIL